MSASSFHPITRRIRSCGQHECLFPASGMLVLCFKVFSLRLLTPNDQVLGFEVEAMNSVQLCCHTGYSVVKGQILGAADLEDLFDGLKQNGLHVDYSHILTGFVSSSSFMSALADTIRELKSANKKIQFVCDPVMGDEGKMYVPEDLLPLYRDRLILMADVLTPNQFEAELLTGLKIVDEESAIRAIDALHAKCIPVVILTSSNLGPNVDKLTMIASKEHSDGAKERFKCEIDVLEAKFTGTGDLTAALLLAWLHKTDGDIEQSLAKTMSSVQSVLMRTIAYALSSPAGLSPRNLELKLIQSKRELESPPNLVTVVRL